MKVKESFIKSFEEFKIFESQELYKEVKYYNVEKIVDISSDNYDKIMSILDEAAQDDIVSFKISKVYFQNDDDDFKVVEYIKILNKVKDTFINIYEMEDEWFIVGITYDYEEDKKYLCDQFYGLECLINELIYI